MEIMLEKPEIKDEAIIDCLQNEFGLNVQKLSFLPLGADLNTAVYRIVTNDKTAYFVKLRKGDFNQASVTVPNFLSDLGIKQIIPSIKTQTGQLWALYWLLGLSVSFFGILGGNFVRRFSFSLQGGLGLYFKITYGDHLKDIFWQICRSQAVKQISIL